MVNNEEDNINIEFSKSAERTSAETTILSKNQKKLSEADVAQITRANCHFSESYLARIVKEGIKNDMVAVEQIAEFLYGAMVVCQSMTGGLSKLGDVCSFNKTKVFEDFKLYINLVFAFGSGYQISDTSAVFDSKA